MSPDPGNAWRGSLITVGLLLTAATLWALREVLMLVGFAALLAFALDPVRAALQRLRTPRGPLPRSSAAAIVMLTLVAVGVWALIVVVPRLLRELAGFVEGAPASLDRLLMAVRAYAVTHRATEYLGPLGGADPVDSSSLLQSSGLALLKAIGGQLDNLGSLVGLALIPILAFYLLSEREAVETSALGFVPQELRPRVQQILRAINLALRSYVRGQSLVCAAMGVLVGVTLALLGFPAAALLGTVVAFAEIVPILGFWIAAMAIVLTGWGVSPGLALAGFVAYLVINQAVQLFLTPRVMGRHMKMHPFVVTVSILAGGTLLGAAGAILALPLAAAIQSVVSEFAKPPARAGKGA